MITRGARVLLTGTLAVDHIGHYAGEFAELPRHPGINLAVQLSGIERRFGGCAMNIAYTLRLLGHRPAPFVLVGQDCDADYLAHLRAIDLDTSGVRRLDAPHGARAFVFTDRQGNQFTAFFGGPPPPADFAARLEAFVRTGFDYAVLAPDVPDNMIAAAKALRAQGVPFLTDPGQNITDFSSAAARQLVGLSTAVIVNAFEHDTLRDMVGDALDALDLLVVTEGAQGARWRCGTVDQGRQPAAPAKVVDPTGCGDAWRGGFVHARLLGADLAAAARAGATVAGVALEVVGTQNHRRDDIARRHRAAWGEPFPAVAA